VATSKDKLIAGAQKLVEKGQFEKAIKEYLKVVATDDKDVRIWLKIGDLYAKLGKKQEASETYQKVAEFYSDQGFYLKSVAVYKQILKIDPRLIDVNQRLAELYKQLGLLSDAMSQYETVAAFFHKEGRTRDALAALKQIVDLDPETVANRIKLAELYSKEQMPREAIDEFSRAAEQLKESGRTDDYMKVAERLLFHSPDNRPVSKELAKLYIDKGDPRRALPKLQVCFKADPRDTDVLALLAKAFEALDQRAKSVSVLKELARILGENGDRNGRDDVYRKILMLTPGDPDAEAALAGKPRAASATAAPVQNVMPNFGSSWPPRNALNTTGSQPLIRDDPPEDEFDDKPDEVVTRKPPVGAVQTAVGQLIDGTPPAPDGEAVAKILNETDVYIKYKLYAKAIEHVQRVFEHDPRHVEAREKLKALYLSVGKREEAILELWALAEQAEPSRKRRYLREILELDPHNVKAANQLGTDVGIKPEELDGAPPLTSALREPSHAKKLPGQSDRKEGSNAEPLDVDELEELADDEFDVADPSSKISLALADADADAGAHDELGSGARYREEPHDAAVTADGEDDLIPLVVEPAADAPMDEPPAPVEDRFGFGDEDSGNSSPVDETAIESEIEDEQRPAAMAPTDSERHAVTAGVEAIAARPPRERARKPADDDHQIRTRFDDAPLKFLEKETLFGGGNEEVDESELPPVANLRTAGTATVPKAAVLRGDDDEPLEPDTATSPPSGEAASSLEDDLDEADFFVQQSLFDEARDILSALLERHPSHPLVSAKLRDLDAMERAAAPAAADSDEGAAHADAQTPTPDAHAHGHAHDHAHASEAATHDATPPVDAADSALAAEPPDALPGSSDAESPAADGDAGDPVYEVTRRGVIEKGVTAEDFETHYDLGIAYKEMGLLDDAIAEFKLVMKDPAREVQCHLMIGLCCLEKGLQTEAIGHFKKGLYVEGITERESLSLYFELGQAYERLGDPREALYYYEKVVKRDARFRNVEKLVELLRGGATQATAAPATPGGDDVDAAFDTLLDGNGT
jgi:tetratricopeptide (TPR) repeat protein